MNRNRFTTNRTESNRGHPVMVGAGACVTFGLYILMEHLREDKVDRLGRIKAARASWHEAPGRLSPEAKIIVKQSPRKP